MGILIISFELGQEEEFPRSNHQDLKFKVNFKEQKRETNLAPNRVFEGLS
jgi:hypothetical protein